MPPNPTTSGHHQRVRSSPEIPSEEYRVLYEFELRLSDKLEKLREQTKEDMTTAIALSVQPLMSRFDRIDARLESGEDRFERQEKHMEFQDKRLDEHSDVLDKTSALYAERDRLRGVTTAVQKTVRDKASGGWISVDKIPAILTAAGILISTVIGSIALLRTPNAPGQIAASPSPPALTAPSSVP